MRSNQPTSRPCRRGGDRSVSARRARRGGFTLIESMLVMVIVGTGVLSIVAAQQAYHRQNDYAQRAGTAMLLANELREVTLALPQSDPITGTNVWGPEANELDVAQYDDMDDFDGPDGTGLEINPPIDGLRQEIPNMDRWTQHVVVENVLDGFISTDEAAPDNSTGVVRITCRVLYQKSGDDEPREVTRLTWVRAGGE